MEKLYWDSADFDDQKFFFTVTDKGLNFVSTPGKPISEMFDFYPKSRYQYSFVSDNLKTDPYLDELEAYLKGDRKSFDLALDLSHTTASQQKIYKTLKEIPYGQTITYHQLAKMIGKPKATRAVAHAVAMNPILIVIPCHRIIKASGKIGNYRGGEDMKKALLNLEQQEPVEKPSLIKRLPIARITQLGRPDL